MTRETKPAVVLLSICAVVDLVAAPPMLLASGGDGPGPVAGVLTLVLGILTAIAAVGLARRARWAKPLAHGGRVLDILTAVPGFAAAMPAPVIVSAVILLSLVTIVAVARADLGTATAATYGDRLQASRP